VSCDPECFVFLQIQKWLEVQKVKCLIGIEFHHWTFAVATLPVARAAPSTPFEAAVSANNCKAGGKAGAIRSSAHHPQDDVPVDRVPYQIVDRLFLCRRTLEECIVSCWECASVLTCLILIKKAVRPQIP
jgi:hypothetical protein